MGRKADKRILVVKVMSTPVDDIEVEEGLEVGEELNLTPDPLPEVRNCLLNMKYLVRLLGHI